MLTQLQGVKMGASNLLTQLQGVKLGTSNLLTQLQRVKIGARILQTQPKGRGKTRKTAVSSLHFGKF